MRSVSTHVLDVHLGRPAAGVPVTLDRRGAEGFERLAEAVTDADGRVRALVPEGELTAGTYRITFDTGAYFAGRGTDGFYPEASVVFVVREPEGHYHVPLLLSAHGYSTYRGS